MAKLLSSLMIMNMDGGDRISYTYNEVDDESGELISVNNKKSFVVVDQKLKKQVEAVRNYIRDNKLKE